MMCVCVYLCGVPFAFPPVWFWTHANDSIMIFHSVWTGVSGTYNKYKTHNEITPSRYGKFSLASFRLICSYQTGDLVPFFWVDLRSEITTCRLQTASSGIESSKDEAVLTTNRKIEAKPNTFSCRKVKGTVSNQMDEVNQKFMNGESALLPPYPLPVSCWQFIAFHVICWAFDCSLAPISLYD